VERYGFVHRYNSVKRFVRTPRAHEPERFDVLESLPGEEAQVDYATQKRGEVAARMGAIRGFVQCGMRRVIKLR